MTHGERAQGTALRRGHRRGAGTRHNLLWRRPVDDGTDVDALRWAWNETMGRNEVLGMSFAWQGHVLLRQVDPDVRTRLGVVRFVNGDDLLWELAAQEIAAQPFDLSSPPLVRAVLLRVDGRAELLVCAHDAVLDDSTGAKLVDELLDLARSPGAAENGGALPQPPWGTPARAGSKPATGSLEVLRAAGQPHLHLVHPGGGGTAAYRLLAANLPDTWTVTASEDIGRGDSVESLAALYLRELLARAGVPDMIGGWSLGGLVGFQMARLLVAGRGRTPTLVLLDTPPPGTSGKMPAEPTLMLEMAGVLWTSLGLPEVCVPVVLDTGDDESAMRLLSVGLARAGETVEVDLLLDRLDVYRRHRRALTSYAPTAALAAPALVVNGAVGTGRNGTDPNAADPNGTDPNGTWRRLLSTEPVVTALPGGHYDLLSPGSVDQVADLIVRFASA